MKYSTLLFDVDDTLLNFQAAEHAAMKKLFESIGQPLTPAVYQDYHQLNESLWQRYELGEISRQELLDTRFTLFSVNMVKQLMGKLTRNDIVTTWQKDTVQCPRQNNYWQTLMPTMTSLW